MPGIEIKPDGTLAGSAATAAKVSRGDFREDGREGSRVGWRGKETQATQGRLTLLSQAQISLG